MVLLLQRTRLRSSGERGSALVLVAILIMTLVVAGATYGLSRVQSAKEQVTRDRAARLLSVLSGVNRAMEQYQQVNPQARNVTPAKLVQDQYLPEFWSRDIEGFGVEIRDSAIVASRIDTATMRVLSNRFSGHFSAGRVTRVAGQAPASIIRDTSIPVVSAGELGMASIALPPERGIKVVISSTSALPTQSTADHPALQSVFTSVDYRSQLQPRLINSTTAVVEIGGLSVEHPRAATLTVKTSTSTPFQLRVVSATVTNYSTNTTTLGSHL